MSESETQSAKQTNEASPPPEASGVSHANAKKVLHFPEDLLQDEGGTRECIRFAIRKRDDLDDIPKAIYLYMTPGFSLADGASYQGDAFNTFGKSAVDAINAADQGSNLDSILDGVLGGIKNTGQQLIGSNEALADTGALAASLASSKLGVAGKAALLKQGRAINPFQNVMFAGTILRTFSFSYKLIAESKEEAKMIREIENTFRKFLYPEEAASGFLLKYPPYFQIQFLRKTGVENGEGGITESVEENPNLPFLHLTYLQSMTATYNSSTNAFYEEGRPVELDLSLTFQEATNLTRRHLYKESDTAEYTFEREALTSLKATKDLDGNGKEGE